MNIRKKTNQSRVLNSFFFIQTGLLTYLLTRAASKAEVRYITIKSVLAASRTFSCSDVSLEVLAQVSAQKYRQYFLQKCLYWYRQYFSQVSFTSLMLINLQVLKISPLRKISDKGYWNLDMTNLLQKMK